MLAKYVPAIVGAAAALFAGAIVLFGILAILGSVGLDNSVAFALTVVVAVATGMTVGYVTQRTLKKMQK